MLDKSEALMGNYVLLGRNEKKARLIKLMNDLPRTISRPRYQQNEYQNGPTEATSNFNGQRKKSSKSDNGNNKIK